MKKAIFFILLTPFSLLGLIFLYISSLDINEKIICSVDNEAFLFPKSLCKTYLYNFTNKDDAKALDETYGISYLFSTEDEAEKYEILDIFIKNEINIDKPSNIDGLTPINTAILFSDYKLVSYLISKGANLNVKDSHNYMTPFEYVNFLIEKDPSPNREKIKKLISEQRAKDT